MESQIGELLGRDLERGFDALVRTHQDQIFAFALGMTASWAEAQEVAQEAFVRAWRALGSYPAERRRALKPRPWLHQIALNVFRNRVRRRTPRVVPLEAGLEVQDASRPGPEEQALSRERRRELLTALAGISERQREAVVLVVVEDLSYSEASLALGRPIGTLKSDVHRGLAALRARLAQEVSA